MGYVVGVSSGMFMAAEAAEKLQYITIPQKIFYGGTKGVNFTMVDIESITEFKEPDLEKEVEKIKKLGMRFGVHGESYAMGGSEKPISMLDSAIETEYIHAHQRLIQHIEGCGKIGAEFINIHPSETTPFLRLGVHMQPTRLVDPWGRPLRKLLEENPWLIEWVLDMAEKSKKGGGVSIFREYFHSVEDFYESSEQKFVVYTKKTPDEEEKKKLRKEAFEEAKEYIFRILESETLHYGPERIAYFIIAKWMQQSRDPLWKSIVGKELKDEELQKFDKIQDWIPAVSSKYIAGHFRTKGEFQNPLPLLEKYKVYFLFETQMGGGGTEGMFRLMRPRDMIEVCKSIGSKWVAVTIDMEHMLAQNIDPKKEIESIGKGEGKYVKLWHLGWPTPHVPAHVPIPLGSKQQLYIYERLYELRQKGFKDGWLVFERAGPVGGRDPIQESIIVLKLVAKFLEQDVAPKNLPAEFYGLTVGGPEIKRQEIAIKEHFLDPLKGMLSVPEEEYTFLGSEVIKKGKRPEEWRKEEYR